MAGYWEKTLARRVSRRRALAAGAATTAAAAFLVACGGDDDDDGASTGPATGVTGATGGSTGESTGSTASTGSTGATGSTGSTSGATSGLLAEVTDTTASAKPGGTWINPLQADILNMDPYGVTIGSAHAPWGYSRLVRSTPAKYPESPDGSVDGDGAESWEITPDGLTFTFKLRDNLILDPRPPTSGRKLTAEDVVFSADKFKAGGVSRGEFFNELSPNSPVQSVEAPDAQTVVVKMAYPKANMLSSFAFQRYLWMMPAEADGGFDPKAEMRGTGAWRLERWEPSVGMNYVRNDTWHLKPVFFDRMEQPIISEYAQRRAQLLSGKVGAFSPGDAFTELISEDLLPAKSEQPKLNLYAKSFPDSRPAMISFGFLDGSPFHDTRVRQAVSMLLDRDAFIDAFYNVSAFEAEGLPVESRWHSHFAAGEPPYWIDPKGEGLGEGAKNFQYNPQEAMTLVRAAGHNDTLSMPGWISGAASESSLRQQEVIQEMLHEGNLFDISINSVPRNDFNVNYFNGGGLYEGLVLSQGPGVSGDIDNHITVRFNVTAAPPQCLLREVYPFYEETQRLIEAQRQELVPDKRFDILTDLQKEMALQMPAVPWPGIANGFNLAWPWMGNFNAYTAKSTITAPSESWPSLWYDVSKA
jgi:peptide/nickel transport system substrate-binding protein